MDKLFPIIRRARRPLYPPDDVAPAVLPAVVEVPPAAPVVEPVADAPAEAPSAPSVEAKPKKGKRGANAPA